MAERSTGPRIGVALAVAGCLVATVVGLLAFSAATDAFYAVIYAGCPPEKWSQALLAESGEIAAVPSESAGYYSDCDGSGETDLVVAERPDEVQCAAIVERAGARGWTVIKQTAPCELVLSRELDGRTVWLTLTSDADATSGGLNLQGQWHRQP